MLALAGLGVLGYTLINQKTEDLEEVTLTDNKFINEINGLIDDLKNSAEAKFSKDDYDKIIYLIDEYHDNNKISPQWSANLRKKVEYIYHDKFIKEAEYVFNQSNWSASDITFIREETKRLNNSPYLQEKAGLKPIERVLSEYDGIQSFITRAKSYANSNTITSMTQEFDISTVDNYLNEAKAKLKTSSKVKNNQQLMNELKKAPHLMYNKHLAFLREKVKKAKGEGYSKYNKDYTRFYNGVCQPIFDDINDFKDVANQKYGVTSNDWYDIIEQIKSDVSEIARYAKNDLQKNSYYGY